MSSKKKMLRNHIRRDKLWNQDLTVIKQTCVLICGYKVNEQQTYFSTHSPLWNYEILETEDNSFIAFADEIMAMYY